MGCGEVRSDAMSRRTAAKAAKTAITKTKARIRTRMINSWFVSPGAGRPGDRESWDYY
jgi:hypothetical protein